MLKKGSLRNFHLAPGEIYVVNPIFRDSKGGDRFEGHHFIDLCEAKGVLVVGALVLCCVGTSLGEIP